MAIYSSASHEENVIYPFLLSDKLPNTQGKPAVGTWTMYHHQKAVVSLNLPLSPVATALSPHLWPPIA